MEGGRGGGVGVGVGPRQFHDMSSGVARVLGARGQNALTAPPPPPPPSLAFGRTYERGGGGGGGGGALLLDFLFQNSAPIIRK